jgi:5-oxoprolinase (ATP-hydrolysing) subunit A
MHFVDINCDLGEGQTLDDCAQEAKLMPYISRCNIACGGHAGNTLTMQHTLHNAKQYKLKCGAHPAYPDKANFGRTSLLISSAKLLESLKMQITALQQLAHGMAIDLNHIKLHGALYNDAEKSIELAMMICQMLALDYPHLVVLGLPQGAMRNASQYYGLKFLCEGFMDRAYLGNGQLAPRTHEGAVYQNVEQSIEQVMAMLSGEKIWRYSR